VSGAETDYLAGGPEARGGAGKEGHVAAVLGGQQGQGGVVGNLEALERDKRVVLGLDQQGRDADGGEVAPGGGLFVVVPGVAEAEGRGGDAVVEVDGSEYVAALAEKVDNRAHSETDLRGSLTKVFQALHEQMNSGESLVDFSSPVRELVAIVEPLKLKKSTAYSDFYNVVLRKFFGIGVEIQFNGKGLRELSMGERAIILLKVLLALDDKPLLIDQPEEHLDNRYIFEELTPAIREAKKRRQIIIATHNANLVVNTDAEQIFIAQSKNSRLTYKPATLEDLSTREDVKTILEGGHEAFKKREEKYGYIF